MKSLLSLSRVALSIGLAMAGCGESTSAGRAPGADAGTGGGSGGGTGGTTSCGDAHVCIASPGVEWEGPLALADAADGCGAEFPNEAQALFEGLDGGEAACACTCGEPAGSTCADMRVYGFAQTSCVDRQGFNPISSLTCFDTFAASHAISFPPAPSFCDMGTVIRDIDDPVWARGYVACDGHTAGEGECDASQICVPRPGFGFNAGICYSRAGDEACPVDFPNKLLLHSGFADSRRCPQTCDCLGVDAACEVTVSRYGSPGCSDPLGRIDVPSGTEECVAPFSSSTQSLTLGSRRIVDSGRCVGEDLSVEGAVSETGTVTICCN